MNKITHENIETCFRLGLAFAEEDISFDDAVSEAASSGMNRASASDYIRNVKYMLDGFPYKRTISAEATRYYLEHIFSERGIGYLGQALTAVEGHVAYYESLQSVTLHTQRKVIAEYSKLLAVNEVADFSDGESLNKDFQASVQKSLDLSDEKRKERLASAFGKARKIVAKQLAFVRNPDVVAERLSIAAGVCEGCMKPAPFWRPNGTPFLEVHHKLSLAEGGLDVVENTMALCPNCHREAHFGQNRSRFL